MAEEQSSKRIDTSLPFNDQLESSSPSAKVTVFVLGGLVAIIVGITLLVKFS